MSPDDLAQIVRSLRTTRTDVANVEVKRAAGGLGRSILATLSAFGNLPGGGLILLGLDEEDGFRPVTLADPASLSAALASQARTAVEPPLLVDIETIDFESRAIVVAQVHEVPASHKPCVLVGSRKAYIRSFDGDYQLSELETQGLLSNRAHPAFDLGVVEGATRADLDESIISDFLRTARSMNSALARLQHDDEILYRGGATTASGEWTLAGCLTFGRYPQQWFPNLTIQAAVVPAGSVSGELRALDTARFDGPVPTMLADASEWLARQMRHRIAQDSRTGVVSDILEYPALAIREVLANAIVHRDLAPWSLSRAIEVRLAPDGFTVTNPGGLFGVSTQQLGRQGLTSARNGALVRLNQYTHSRNQRVIEALATGIPTVLAELRSAGQPVPLFFDQGIAFTVKLRSSDRRSITGLAGARQSQVIENELTPAQRRIFGLLDAPQSVNELAEALGLAAPTIRKQLVKLVHAGLVESTGGRGDRSTKYRRTRPIVGNGS
jgi:ATP-dependent DNA helicase RecG